MTTTSGMIEAIERILNRGGGDAEVLRAVVEAIHDRGVEWVAIRAHGETFAAGAPRTDSQRVRIAYSGEPVGELEAVVDDDAFLERVAVLISAHVKRHHAGEPWSP